MGYGITRRVEPQIVIALELRIGNGKDSELCFV